MHIAFRIFIFVLLYPSSDLAQKGWLVAGFMVAGFIPYVRFFAAISDLAP